MNDPANPRHSPRLTGRFAQLFFALLCVIGSGCMHPQPIRHGEKPGQKIEESATTAKADQQEAPVPLPDNAVGRSAEAFVEFLKKADESAVEAFVSTHFEAEFRDHAPMNIHTLVLASVWKKHPEPVLRQVFIRTDFSAELYLQSSVDKSWTQITLQVESKSPHRINSLRARSIDGPPDPALWEIDPEALTDEQRRKIVAQIVAIMRKRYVDPEVGISAGRYVEEAIEKGEYDNILKLEIFAERLTEDLRHVTKDRHVRVHPEGTPSSALAPAPPPTGLNGLEEATALSGNIGYINLRLFLMARKTIASAMKTIENTDAIIFDVRKSPGGVPQSVQYWCSYLFDTKTHLNSLYWREGDRTEEFWTLDEIDGKKRPHVPVFVLTSESTFSGAEEFAYNLQTRERATIVGQSTGGGANPAPKFSISPHLTIRVSTGKAINPVTQTNWEGVGVKPDVEVAAERALEKALTLAKRAAKKYRESKRHQSD